MTEEGQNNILSIVIPFYGGWETIRATAEQCSTACSVTGLKHRIIVVNDTGNKGSMIKLETELAGLPNVGLIHLDENLGQHNATFIGLRISASGDVITIDDDLKFPAERISELVALAKSGNAEVAYGIQPRNGFSGAIREGILGFVKPLLANNYPKRTSSFRFIRADVVYRMTASVPKFVQMEGLIFHHANQFEYLDLPSVESNSQTGYSFFSLFSMFSGLINHYSMVPLVLLGVMAIFINVLLLFNSSPFGFWVLPIGVFGLMVIWSELRIRKRRAGLIAQVKSMKRQ